MLKNWTWAGKILNPSTMTILNEIKNHISIQVITKHIENPYVAPLAMTKEVKCVRLMIIMRVKIR